MDLLSAKIVAMVLMGTLALFFGLLPLKVKLMIFNGQMNSKKRKKREKIISGLLCFGSGVLIATVFIHMIPETREGFERLRKIKSVNQPDVLRHHSHDNNSHDFFEDPTNNIFNNEHESHDHNHDHQNTNVHQEEGNQTSNDNHHHHHHHNHNHNPSHDLDDHKNLNDSQNVNMSSETYDITFNNNSYENDSHAHHHDHSHSDQDDMNHASDGLEKNHGHNNSKDDHNHGHNHDDDTNLTERNGKEKDIHNSAHDHFSHDDFDPTSEHDASHSIKSPDRSSHHFTNLNSSEYEKDVYDESGGQSLHSEQNHPTTIKTILSERERDSEVNSDNHSHSIDTNNANIIPDDNSNQKNHNHAHNNSTNMTILLNHIQGAEELPSTGFKEISSESHDHLHHNHSKIDNNVYSHHDDNAANKNDDSKNHDDHMHDTNASTMSSLDNINNQDDESLLESIIEHRHNDDIMDINNVVEKHLKMDKGIILPKDAENDKDSVPKFEALKQVEEERRHHEHGMNENQKDHNDHASHEHDHEHDHDSHHDHEHSEDSHGYPIAELIICLGFLLIYLIEEIVHKLLLNHSNQSHHHHHHHHHEGHHHHHGHHPQGHHHQGHHHHISPSEDEGGIEVGSVQTQISSIRRFGKSELKDKDSTVIGLSITSNNNHKWEEKDNQDQRLASQGIDNPAFAGDIEATTWNPRLRNSIITEANNQVVPTSVGNGNAVIGNGVSSVVQRPDTTLQQEDEKSKSTMKGICEHVLSNVRSLLVVIALSFHSIFEGLAVGLQEVQKDVWYLFLAISAHKFVIAFCIGLEFLEAGTPLVLYLLYIVVLAVITPIGVGIGIIVTENQAFGGVEHYYIITILQGLAGGTLLYVALLEVLERERNKPGGRLIKLLCLAFGFGTMASLEAIGGGHSHGPVEGGH